MAVTQEQHLEVVKQIADLRVHVETLTGRLDVTNERLSNTNEVLRVLNQTLKEQSDISRDSRKFMVGNFFASLAIIVSVVGVILTVLLRP